MPRRSNLTLILTAAMLLVHDVAWACPVCFDPNEQSRGVFLLTTAVMTFVPLILIGGVARRPWTSSTRQAGTHPTSGDWHGPG